MFAWRRHRTSWKGVVVQLVRSLTLPNKCARSPVTSHHGRIRVGLVQHVVLSIYYIGSLSKKSLSRKCRRVKSDDFGSNWLCQLQTAEQRNLVQFFKLPKMCCSKEEETGFEKEEGRSADVRSWQLVTQNLPAFKHHDVLDTHILSILQHITPSKSSR